jgi:hypothetical protein
VYTYVVYEKFQVQREERYGIEKMNIGNVEYWNNKNKDEQRKGRKSKRTNLK